MGVLEVRRSRSKRLRAPLVGVSTVELTVLLMIDFRGVLGVNWDRVRERGFVFEADAICDNAFTATSSSSISDNFRFPPAAKDFSIWGKVIVIESILVVFSIIALVVVLLPLDTWVKAPKS